MNWDGANQNAGRRDYVLLFARVLMASLFVFSGLEKLFDFDGVIAFASSHGWPLARPLMPLAILFELSAALMLLAGWHFRLAAAAFVVWTLVLGVWFHRFWLSSPGLWQVTVDDFFHHFVMAGGFLALAAQGPGRVSLDARAGRG